MELEIGSVRVKIDVEGTRKMYSGFRTIPGKLLIEKNFLVNLRRQRDAVFYFSKLGIAIKKSKGLRVEEINLPDGRLIYTGYCPIIASNEQELISYIKSDAFSDDLSYIKTNFDFELSLDHCDGKPALYFYTKLPWLLSKQLEKAKEDKRMFGKPNESLGHKVGYLISKICV